MLFAGSLLIGMAQAVAANPPPLCTFGPAPNTPTVSRPRTMNCLINGEQRQALVYAPALTPRGNKLPVVFAFHGHGGTMSGTAKQMHIHTLWAEAIVLYPQGLASMSSHDPNGERAGWQQETGLNGDRDLKFFDAMLDTVKQQYNVDGDRIYVTGFSNGGAFSYLLWAERGHTIAAIGVVAGRLWESVHLSQARALLAVAGKTDTTGPFAAQEQSIETARQIDHATGPGQACGQYCTRYSSTSQTPVRTFIHPGAHVYPPWAPDEIVKFFKNHKKA
jgi:polyhydroxybutyrate depolymerase